MSQAKLVFVAGYPRSGTTWFANLLNAHPSVIYRHEYFGRKLADYSPEMQQALKQAAELSAEQYQQLVHKLLAADVDTDRPPFFTKDYFKINHTGLRKILWLAASKLSPLRFAYDALYHPTEKATNTLVIKETRSSVNLQSIIQASRAEHSLFLWRHPYGTIASHLKGREKGLMPSGSAKGRSKWWLHNQDSPVLQELAFDEEKVLALSDVAFIALRWKVQNEDYLAMADSLTNSQFLSYEAFLAEPQQKVSELFASLGMNLDQQVLDFVQESSSNNEPSMMKKDAGDAFYSVYRGKDFDPEKWRKVLSEQDQQEIDQLCSDTLAKLQAQ